MRYNEKVFMSLVERGVFKLYKNGNIYRCKKKKNQYGDYEECESILQRDRNNKGYITITFYYQGKKIHILISRAIWLYFNGSISKRLEINHKNGITDDNRLSNLEIITHKENLIHAVQVLDKNNKLTKNNILKIRKLLRKGITQRKIAGMFNIGKSTINYINTKRSWAWLN